MKPIRFAVAALVLLAAGCGDPNPTAPATRTPSAARNVSDGGSAMGSGNLTESDSTNRGGMTMGSGNLTAVEGAGRGGSAMGSGN